VLYKGKISDELAVVQESLKSSDVVFGALPIVIWGS
jgi:hypothetical protein